VKIALVSPYDWSVPGGVNSHVSHLAMRFRAAGHDARIVAPASRPVEDCDYLHVVGTHVIGLPAAGSVAHVSLSFDTSGKVKRLLKEEQFDLVHIHEPFMPLLPFVFLRQPQGATVATFHAAREGGNRLYAYSRHLIKPWMQNLSGRITVSRTAMRLVGKYLAGRYRIIPNGVDNSFFAANVPPMPRYMDAKKNILFLGRLEKRKGLTYLLQAYALVKRQKPDVRLIIVGGDGGMRIPCERYVEREGLSDVVFAGYVPNADVPRYYRTADVYCAPNTGAESQGIVLLEAMAAGTPIVASNIEGFADVVSHKSDGLLVPPQDVEALAAALLKVIQDQDLRESMGRAGAAKAERYSWEHVSQRVLDFYSEILGQEPLRDDPIQPDVLTPSSLGS